MSLRDSVIGAGFSVFRATGLHRALAPLTQGVGAILMFHHVRPFAPALPGYAPNRLLEITPEFFARALDEIRGEGFEIVTLDEAAARLGRGGGRFAALTFDDGYRDNVEYALPILRQRSAPFTVFATPGFADRTASLWWIELEEAILRLPRVALTLAGEALDLPAADAAEKSAAFAAVYRRLRALPEPDLLAGVAALAKTAGVDGAAIAGRLCLDWQGLSALAADPLCTIGAHTMTHPRLATLPPEQARAELVESRRALAEGLGRPVVHVAYPVGDPTSAGPRDFALAAAAGFASGVTTRPGMLFPAHADHRLALPRVSVNGRWQRPGAVATLLSGAPFALWNRGRRVNCD